MNTKGGNVRQSRTRGAVLHPSPKSASASVFPSGPRTGTAILRPSFIFTSAQRRCPTVEPAPIHTHTALHCAPPVVTGLSGASLAAAGSVRDQRGERRCRVIAPSLSPAPALALGTATWGLGPKQHPCILRTTAGTGTRTCRPCPGLRAAHHRARPHPPPAAPTSCARCSTAAPMLPSPHLPGEQAPIWILRGRLSMTAPLWMMRDSPSANATLHSPHPGTRAGTRSCAACPSARRSTCSTLPAPQSPSQPTPGPPRACWRTLWLRGPGFCPQRCVRSAQIPFNPKRGLCPCAATDA